MTKYVYTFGAGKADGRADMKNLLGGKGANLAEMNSIGLPVPAGFTITTEMCTVYYENNRKYPEELKKQVDAGLKHIEATMGAKFGDKNNPLLVSVRSGARVSMPGMMDTVLNLGLNDETVQGIIKQTGNANNGEIVVARVGEENRVTLKRFYLSSNAIELRPENPKYGSLYSKDVTVLGKLHMIIRDYEH